MQTIAAKVLAQTQFVPLMEAVLCVDCEMVSNSTHGHCPACGGRALLNVATALGGPLHAKPEVSQEAIGHAMPARVLVLRKEKHRSRR
jgi:hypothetical protein